jgi:REP element-mobilizing transposase RayT
MARKYAFSSLPEEVYFITSTVVRWIDIFTRDLYRQIIIDSLSFCQKEKALDIYAWVIMTNHLHMIAGRHGAQAMSDIMRDFKAFTSRSIRKSLENSIGESRQDWLLWMFERQGIYNRNNKDFQLWQQGNHPVLLDTREKAFQRLHYTHYNPVKAGFVLEPQHWRWSSAIDYCGGKGLLSNLIIIE